MDETTQHNAALVERIAATSFSLKKEGDALNKSVANFRLE
jgi:methyl-accepting chemotaxis protein